VIALASVPTALALLLEIRYPWIDPVAIDLPGPLAVRWYGLMYLVAFGIGYVVLRRLARDDFLRLDPAAVGDLITALVLGVILGGRLGYILFYDYPAFAANPARIIRIWEGGLSFHGGLLGVVVATAWFARRHRVTFLNLSDALALGVPFGIFAVRIANFINGELYGRLASGSVPWAMRFPTDPVALRLLGAEQLPMRERELAIGEAYRSGLWDQIRDQVPLRHPSQLYNALGEGVLVGLVLWLVFWWMRRSGRRFGDGAFAGLFLVGYGAVRVVLELFRQPDVQFTSATDPLGTVLGPLTMGQTLSSLMILAGLMLLVYARRHRPQPSARARVPAGR
jgi:phosphatidylglycerol:prolipoprotein diacylglycerol transferase